MAMSVTNDQLTGAFREIIKNHDEAIQLCDQLASAARPADRSRLLISLPENVRTLIHSEDGAVFNESIYRDNNLPDVSILRDEQHEIDSLISQLAAANIDSKDWRNKVQALTDLVEMHAVGTLDFLSSIHEKLISNPLPGGVRFSSNQLP